MGNKAITLLYHDVISGENADESGFSGTNSAEYKLSCTEFEEHLQAINNSLKSKVIEATQLFDEQYEKAPVLFSFDDGGVGAFHYIAPMLEKYGWRGCFFITTDKIGDSAFLNETQIKELYERGHVIGSHSCSHPKNMVALDREQIFHEWHESKKVLSDIVENEVSIASIPSGFYSKEIAQEANRAGIKILFTSEPQQRIFKMGECAIVGRFSVKRGMGAVIPGKIVSNDISLRVSQYAYWNLKKFAKKISGPVYPWIRSKYLSKNKSIIK